MASLSLSGTVDQPRDNFAEMARKAAGGGTTGTTDGGGRDADLEREFEDLIEGGGR